MAEDLAKEGRDKFAECESAELHNRTTYKDDTIFAREGKQWPDDIAKRRLGRPMLTINKMPAFIRQVVNDARQNKPSIKVHPVDSGADTETAEVINGLIRNIEYTSNADVAYDTATECAVGGGFGYLRIVAKEDDEYSFDSYACLAIERVANPLSVYGDPNSTAADSSDWDDSFVVDQIPEKQFKAEYGEKATTDFSADVWTDAGESWRNRDAKTVTVAEWWKRRPSQKTILLLSDDRIIDEERLKTPEFQAMLEAGAFQVVNQRVVKCHKVTQHIMSGAEVLKTHEWPGKYIPIVPVYGDEFNIEGKRYFRSLIHGAKDAQMMFNVWRSTSTELVGLSPRVPYIGPKGAFDSDQDRWNTANTHSHSYLEYDPVAEAGGAPPQRQPLDMGVAAGAIQEALNASDDMKTIIGLYDASLGARSNETSGKAIMARQREGDVSTFHFIDNMARAIRHTGRILIDLIPHYYNTPRVIRVIGEDGKQEAKPVNQEYPVTDPKTGQPVTEEVVDEFGQKITRGVMAMHDLRTGKYDLTVTTGPSFTTRREEAAYQMTEAIRAMPDTAPVILPELAKNSDWPGADKIAEKLEALNAGPQIPPELEQKMADDAKALEQLTAENQQLKMDQSAEMAKIEAQKTADASKLQAQMISDQAKVKATEQIELIKLRSNEQIKMAELAMEERIAIKKAELDARVATHKAEQSAKASVAAAAMKPQPTGNSNGQSR